ncbi:MAG: hypothetical protein WDN24_03475 [Sphingomonas sp.]
MGLALALVAQETLPGVRFHCGSGGFQVFAPQSKLPAAYATDHPLAQRTAAWDGAPPYTTGFEKIADDLPARLTLSWRREHNSPVTLAIAGYDAAAATARYTLSAERNPASALFTPMTAGGTCTAQIVQETAQ